jgi:putative ABC transport system substrate-binding protein
MKRREFIALVGGVALQSTTTWAQKPVKVHRIALFHPSVPVTHQTGIPPSGPAYRAFFAELGRLGYVEGENLLVERYSGEGHIDKYGELARTIVQRTPDIIWALSSRMVQHLKAATSVIPIVGFMADPTGFELVSSLSRPGGNVTGVTADVGLDVWSKRLELLKEAVPSISRVGILISSDLAKGHATEVTRETASKLGILLVGPPLMPPMHEAEYRRVFLAMSEEHADGLVIGDQPEHFTITNRQTIANLGKEYRLPIIGTYRHYAAAGVLLSYGVDDVDLFRISATQVDQILKGASPADLPVQQPTKLQFVVNAQTANALGLAIPATILARADEVIEQ